MERSNTVELYAAGGQSAQGARPNQEDDEYIILTPEGGPNEIGDSIAFFAVFDGHGTGIVSHHAKEHIPLLLFESDAFRNGNFEQAMQAAIDKEDELLLQGLREGQNFFATSGSTASLAIVDMKKGVLVVGNIGDSHILMAERDPQTGQVKSERLTTSHKPESADEKARIKKAGGHVHSHHDISRIGSLNMSRALGDLQYKTPLITAAEAPKTEGQIFATAPDPQDVSAQDEAQAGTGRDNFITVEMSFRRIDLHKEKQYLLALTTDGVTNVLDDGKIMNGIAQMFNAGSKADEVARTVVDQASSTEYADNATCVAVFLNGTEARLA
ncbi:phosphatase 2C-like domain-containing protein [Aspergillus spinulosporus]